MHFFGNPSCHFQINHKMVLHVPSQHLEKDTVHTFISFLKLQRVPPQTLIKQLKKSSNI